MKKSAMKKSKGLVEIKLWCKALMAVCLIVLATHVFANDILQGTDTDAHDTLNGTGKKFIYLGEIIVVLVGFVKTRNVWLFAGIFVIPIFTAIGFHMAGY
jgi:hypothetical protein